ncbi:MAG: rRNA pseudouridine synthase [Actinobacteria bacterium]|nr:rRNA pseudouridine synthase [Actinomycetota bacterium]MCL5882699.1 rRNA pseudouridine synthase [Actinomycetota bacterium]
MAERLQKYLARAGIASRRKAEELIVAGRITVNGETVTELGTQVQSGDVVWFDGKPVEPEKLEYHLLNKPAGVISAVSDDRGQRTVTELVPSQARLFPVGRLDRDTTGLIILTNDGRLAHGLMHPSFEVDKVYRAEVRGEVDEEALAKLRRGVKLEDGVTSPGEAACVGGSRKGNSMVELVIHEGRKRQVRRMLEAVGHQVVHLHRKRYAMLTDEGLPPGESRPLTGSEVSALIKLGGRKDR